MLDFFKLIYNHWEEILMVIIIVLYGFTKFSNHLLTNQVTELEVKNANYQRATESYNKNLMILQEQNQKLETKIREIEDVYGKLREYYAKELGDLHKKGKGNAKGSNSSNDFNF